MGASCKRLHEPKLNGIESAIGMGSGIGEQRMFGKDRTAFPKALERLTAGDKGRPLIFYCLSSMCWHSYNASLRAMEEGYTQVMWYRGGLEAWTQRVGDLAPLLACGGRFVLRENRAQHGRRRRPLARAYAA